MFIRNSQHRLIKPLYLDDEETVGHMKIDLVFISCNRLHYTRYSIPALLADPSEEFSLTIWDNASTDGSREYLESINDSRIVKKVLSPQNVGAYHAFSLAINESSADLLGFVADDLLVTPGWTNILGAAHDDIPQLGRIACWHFSRDDFDYERARHKIQMFGRHKILRHPWTNGCGLTKVNALREIGLMKPDEGETAYWVRMALAGYVVGYYCPPVIVEHMDDPWSSYFPYKDRFDEWVPQSGFAKKLGLRNVEDAKAWQKKVLWNILDGPWEAKSYIGWRAKVREGKARLRRILLRTRY
jgi:GT2 family glycosyltransferase